jgi:alpha-1,6-mannosyltransferase
MDLLDYIFGATTVFYSLVAPFTKVEESFNLQAVHDILKFGVGHEALPLYDHFEFPGVLPRTFIGALGLSALSWPLTTAIKWVFDESIAGSLSQIAVRATLGLINVFALVMFRHAADRVYGKHVGRWYLILQVTQFHLVFYATRTLPNVFALPFSM